MKRILVIHTFGMGDMIMFTPALQELIKKYPDARIDFLVVQKIAAYPIKKSPQINHIFYASFTLSSLMQTIVKLREQEYDLSLVTSGTNPLKASLFSFLIGAKERIGEYRDFKIPFLYTKNILYIEQKHRVENNLDLLNCQKTSFGVQYYLQTKERSKRRDKPIKVGFHIGSNKMFAKKRWKADYFEKLIFLLKKDFNSLDIVIFSGEDEKEESKKLALKTDSVLYLNLPFDTMASKIAECDLFINSDSGLGHIASCFDVEIFTIFGPAKAYKAKPFSKNATIITLGLSCQPCYGTRDFQRCRHLDCLNRLSAESVFEKIKKESKVLLYAK